MILTHYLAFAIFASGAATAPWAVTFIGVHVQADGPVGVSA